MTEDDKALVKQLRRRMMVMGDPPSEIPDYYCTEAADRIEQLTVEVERLREALKDLLEDTQHKNHDCGDEEWCPIIKARAALGDTQ